MTIFYKTMIFYKIITKILLFLWNVIGSILEPALQKSLSKKLLAKGNAPSRIKERFGHKPEYFPDLPHHKSLLWIHAASVGETRATFPLIDVLLSHKPDLFILLTTATETGAEICQKHPAFGKQLFHQFIPYDTPKWRKKFLDLWHPSGAIFIESELWPGIISSCAKRHIPVMLINARLSDRSFQRWHSINPIFKQLFHSISWISPRSDEDAERFKKLGLTPSYLIGDIKQYASPLPYSVKEEKNLRQIIGKRPIFLAASTHSGEEELIVEAVSHALTQQPHLLTIIVPRHPHRGSELAEKFKAPRRSQGHNPLPSDTLWIADTLGELGLFYRLADCAFIGNSFLPSGGGHNPLEPLRLSCPIAVGPYVNNWHQTYHDLRSHIVHIHDTCALKEWILLDKRSPRLPETKNTFLNALSIRILDTIFSKLTSL